VENGMNEEILTPKEVAEYLKLAEKTAYRLATEEKLPDFKVGGSWRFKKADVEDWIEQRKVSFASTKEKLLMPWPEVGLIAISAEMHWHLFKSSSPMTQRLRSLYFLTKQTTDTINVIVNGKSWFFDQVSQPRFAT